MARAKLTAVVGLNTTGFQRGLRAMRRQWRTFRTAVMAPMQRFGRVVGRTFRRAGLVVGASLVLAIRHANLFRQQMANVSVMVDNTSRFMSDFTKELIRMSGQFGQSKETLAKGLFDILSAGVDAAGSIKVLEVASKAAVGGFTSVAVAVDGMTTLLNSYGLEAMDATRVSDVMFQVVKDGKITFEELAENIGKLAPTAKAAGLSLEEMGAVVAAIVKVEKPERAMTALRASMIKAAEEGITLFQLLKSFEGKNLEDIIGAGIPRRAAQGIAILSSNLGLVQTELDKFQNTAGRTDEAFRKMDKARAWAKLWQSFLGVITKVFTVIDKELGPAVDFFARQLREIGDSPAFKRFVEQAKDVAAVLSKSLVAIAKGGEGRKLALKGFKEVLISSFLIAMDGAVKLLLKFAPIIGNAIGEAAFNAIAGIGSKAGQRAAVVEALAREGKISPIEAIDLQLGFSISKGIDALFEARLQEQKQIDLLAKGEALATMFKSATDSTARLANGFEMIRKAGELATRGEKEFKRLTDAEIAQKKELAESPGELAAAEAARKKSDIRLNEIDKIPLAKFKDGAGAGGEARRFSEFRRIGANILGGGAGGQRGRERAFREKSLSNQKRNIGKLTESNVTLERIAEAVENLSTSSTF